MSVTASSEKKYEADIEQDRQTDQQNKVGKPGKRFEEGFIVFGSRVGYDSVLI